jgi:ankyrin repeat protein
LEGLTDVDALIEAAKDGDERRVRALIAEDPTLAGARLPSGESPVMAALYRGHRALALVLVDLGAELDVFASAALGHRGGLIASLERPGAVAAHAYDGWTALHLASFFGHLEAARILIAAGADPGAVSRNSLHNTPLHAAAAGKHEAIALLLLEHGADPHVPDAGGYSAARIAEENGLAEVVRRTLEHG